MLEKCSWRLLDHDPWDATRKVNSFAHLETINSRLSMFTMFPRTEAPSPASSLAPRCQRLRPLLLLGTLPGRRATLPRDTPFGCPPRPRRAVFLVRHYAQPHHQSPPTFVGQTPSPPATPLEGLGTASASVQQAWVTMARTADDKDSQAIGYLDAPGLGTPNASAQTAWETMARTEDEKESQAICGGDAPGWRRGQQCCDIAHFGGRGVMPPEGGEGEDPTSQ